MKKYFRLWLRYVVLSLCMIFSLQNTSLAQNYPLSSDYQCSDEIHALDGYLDTTYPAWEMPLERNDLIEALGFDSPEILVDYAPDIRLSTNFLLECAVYNDEVYITLVYPGNLDIWHMQIIHFVDDMPIIYHFITNDDFWVRVHSIGNTIIGDLNQNNLPDFIIFGSDICASNVCSSIWILEHQEDGQFMNITPTIMNEEEFLGVEDWNVDGVLDIRTITEVYTETFTGKAGQFISTYGWNGRAYTLINMDISYSTFASEYDLHNPPCLEDSEYGFSWDDLHVLSSDMFATLYYYHHMNDDIETGWVYVRQVIDSMILNCDYNLGMLAFMNNIKATRLYFQPE